ncbi:MAG: DedA family protein, partial [Thiovulaceae bacterium]|nr:DedA family protein [Sulfurimonadaceae bacterium]
TFFPFPSEVVMVPAGYLAAQGEMNIFIVIFLGTLGSVLGALFNFYLALKFGRVMVLKFGKFFFFREKELDRMEAFFKAHGAVSTFTGRLIPGIRQYISLPAGLSRMKISTFVLFTALGAGIWSAVLALLGFFIGKKEELIQAYLHEILIWVFISLVLIIAAYIFWHKKSKKSSLMP